MNLQERLKAHTMDFHPDYQPNPMWHYRSPRDAQHICWVFDHLKESQVSTVLDLGPWDSWLAFLLIQQGYRLSGIELCQNLVDIAKRYAERNLYTYDIRQGCLPDVTIDKKYDAVLALEILEHIDYNLMSTCIDKIEKACKKTVMISLPHQSHLVNPQHLWSPDTENIKELFGHKKDYSMTYYEYGNPNLPNNFLITYNV